MINDSLDEIPTSSYYASREGESICVLVKSKASSSQYEFALNDEVPEIDPILKELTSDIQGYNEASDLTYPLEVHFESQNYDALKKITAGATSDFPVKVILVFDGHAITNVIFFNPVAAPDIEIAFSEFEFSHIINRIGK